MLTVTPCVAPTVVLQLPLPGESSHNLAGQIFYVLISVSTKKSIELAISSAGKLRKKILMCDTPWIKQQTQSTLSSSELQTINIFHCNVSLSCNTSMQIQCLWLHTGVSILLRVILVTEKDDWMVGWPDANTSDHIGPHVSYLD